MSKNNPQIKINIKNFGPINSGTIDLKPLTIFIGQNNSGKSYAAMLISSLFECCLPNSLKYPSNMNLVGTRWNSRKHFKFNKFSETPLFSEFSTQFEHMQKEDILEVPKDLLKSMITDILIDIYKEKLNKEIIGLFACPLKDLITIGENNFSFNIKYDKFSVKLKYKKDKLEIEDFDFEPFKVLIKCSEIDSFMEFDSDPEDDILITVSYQVFEREKEVRIFRFVYNQLFDLIFDHLFKNVSMPHFYLPAARSGIMQGYKALVVSALRTISYNIGIEELEFPKFSGVVSEFLSYLIQIPEKKGEFYALVNGFENKLLKGNIKIKTLDDYSSPEIEYSFQNMEIPLHRSSSTVSELAPIFIYLKYFVVPGSLLIIEEPEAHLHPKNQRLLAQLLVKLVRKDVKILITTHSEYLLEQFDNFLSLSKLNEIKRSKYYDPDNYLNMDEISVYSFKYSSEIQGNIIEEVEIDEEEGISHEEFIKVKEMLYEESYKIHEDLEDE